MQKIANFIRDTQNSLAARVKITALKRPIKLVAGADASCYGNNIIGSACLFTYPSLDKLDKIDESIVIQETDFPYIPGFLSFREAPALIGAIKGLRHMPDAIIVDGQGIAHPRRIGLASHIGVLLDTVTLGAAKSRLIGTYEEPGMEKGSRSPLFDSAECIGVVLRSRTGVRPLFVSPGHLIDIDGAVDMVLSCLSRYRLPEPVRCAHNAASAARQQREAILLGPPSE
ncbi:deoxyribonuclease V [Candidatus Magnetominusculus xianensis]|uniref:Endonuclease V n=1 Tax=Candidatus Magnetominusculus xianensis TaxID=1748249 RepID=A0ABR5SJA0_9BACT|nr:deoxyribonuclease V [Candidatus Magnetominusculus xianensis]KWT91879.1 endonuclease V [Candidatus Magnetominusculus xianensis]MBF0404071.1 endonuclease V [Nitrospirota bacterium]